MYKYIDGLVQDRSESIANALKLLQSCKEAIDMKYMIVEYDTNIKYMMRHAELTKS